MLATSLPDIPVMRPKLPEYAVLEHYIKKIDANGIYTNLGPLVQDLEERLAKNFAIDKDQIVTTSNCTVGLQTALLSVKRAGQFCIMPAWTFVATPHAASSAGLTPYFVDVDFASQKMSIEGVKTAIQTLGLENVGAICLVAPFGAPIDLSTWEELQDQSGIPIVLDAAAAFSTTKASQILTCVSMHATKILPAGEGGFILAPSCEIASDIRARTNFGFSGTRESLAIGGNAKLSEYHAAIGLASLDTWPSRRRKYYQLCNRWIETVIDLEGIDFDDGFGHEWFNSVAVARMSSPVVEAFKVHLSSHGIFTRRWWGKGCHEMPAFSHCPSNDLSNTHRLAQTTLGLPCHFELSEEAFGRMRGAIESFLLAHKVPPLECAA